MKKTVILFLLILVTTTVSFGQEYKKSISFPYNKKPLPPHNNYRTNYQAIDTILFKISYEYKVVYDPDDLTNNETDIYLLEIGSHSSRYYSESITRSDSIALAYIKRGAKNVPSIKTRVPSLDIIKNHQKGKMRVVTRGYFTAPNFFYEESLPMALEWDISNENRIICTFNCLKATSSFRGRDYEAWFTLEVPYSDGPFKFSGLPGLILEIKDSQSHHSFKAIGFEPQSGNLPIKMINYKMKESTREKINALQKKIYSNPEAFLNSLGFGVNINAKDKPINYSIPFNPIELDLND